MTPETSIGSNDAGLMDALRLGVVRESNLLTGLRPMWNRVGVVRKMMPLHYVVMSKECVVRRYSPRTSTCTALKEIQVTPRQRASAPSMSGPSSGESEARFTQEQGP
jgi:hypothetical protein